MRAMHAMLVIWAAVAFAGAAGARLPATGQQQTVVPRIVPHTCFHLLLTSAMLRICSCAQRWFIHVSAAAVCCWGVMTDPGNCVLTQGQAFP